MRAPQPHQPTVQPSHATRLVVRKPGQDEKQVELKGRVSVGRAFDNVIFVDETTASRYHALIEERPDGFWLTDLGSINGTTVNGQSLKAERKLRGGDVISLGGSTVLEFDGGEPSAADSSMARGDGDKVVPRAEQPSSQAPSSSPRAGIIVVAILAPIAVIGAVALVLSGAFNSPSSSEVPVHIVGVRTGDNISKPTRIRTDAGAAQNILQVIYQLDDVDLARVRVPPYETELDPNRLVTILPGLVASNHVLSLVVEDKTGKRSLQPEKIILSFGPGEAVAEPSATDAGAEPANAPAVLASKDISYLANSLARQISKRNQDFSPEFVQAILLATREYRFNFVDDARRYDPREIANAFSNKGLDPLLGFALALSRSKFRPGGPGDSGGVWLIPPPVLAEFAPAEDRASLQVAKRSAEVAASYSKALLGLFDPDDFMYAIACFGMTTMEAGEIRASLNRNFSQADRQDFWKVMNSGLFPKESGSRVAQFFAAGIVGEYPAKFGLQWAPLSSLYN